MKVSKEKKIKVCEACYFTLKQIASPIGRNSSQRKTLVALGLNKMQKIVRVDNNKSIQGMICKVMHLVEIID